jgi:hypothetical protein
VSLLVKLSVLRFEARRELLDQPVTGIQFCGPWFMSL